MMQHTNIWICPPYYRSFYATVTNVLFYSTRPGVLAFSWVKYFLSHVYNNITALQMLYFKVFSVFSFARWNFAVSKFYDIVYSKSYIELQGIVAWEFTKQSCSKCTPHILQLLCKYCTLLFFKSCLPVAMTHNLDLWHLKTCQLITLLWEMKNKWIYFLIYKKIAI